jgi:hypothetical protein
LSVFRLSCADFTCHPLCIPWTVVAVVIVTLLAVTVIVIIAIVIIVIIAIVAVIIIAVDIGS